MIVRTVVYNMRTSSLIKLRANIATGLMNIVRQYVPRLTIHGARSIMVLRLFCLVLALVSQASISGGDEFAKQSNPATVPADALTRLAQRVETDLEGKPERLAQYVDFFQKEIGNDKRLFAFHVTPDMGPDGQVQLRGYVEFPETRSALIEFLNKLSFTINDQLETLPSGRLGQSRFGLLKVSHSYSYDRPDGQRSVETDCLIGEPLYLLREERDHLLAHSGEGYLGYVRSDDVRRVDEAEFARYLYGPTVRILANHEVERGLLLPAGARLKWVSTQDGVVTVQLPTGEPLTIPATTCEVHTVSAADVDQIVASAKQLLGTEYLWGGRTSQGVDCSGLVQIACAAAGIHLPRDSYQQFYVGRLTATRWHRAGLARGDTLYFLGDDGKIRHTGLYLGNDQVIHAVSPVVRINSFHPQDKNFDARRAKSFAFAKRPME
jgi:hypothetical protein